MKEFEIIEGNKEECGEKQREKAAKMVDLWGRQYQNESSPILVSR